MKEGTIVGVDNLNSYYDPSLKEYRLQEIDKAKPAGIDYHFFKGSIAENIRYGKTDASMDEEAALNPNANGEPAAEDNEEAAE